MGDIMQHTIQHTKPHRPWTHGMGLERRYGLPRGMLLSNSTDTGPILARVLDGARLDGATLNRLAGILAVTVREWSGRMPDQS
jgi:hypothetical protein